VESQNSPWARILVFVGLTLWLISLFLHEERLVAAGVVTVVGAAVYWSGLGASAASPS